MNEALRQHTSQYYLNRGKLCGDMSRDELIAWIGELDSFVEELRRDKSSDN